MSIRMTTSAVVIALALTAAPVAAQIGPGPDNPAGPRTATERDAEQSHGWIGVLGLLGALGLVGARRRATSREHDFAGGRSTASMPTTHH